MKRIDRYIVLALMISFLLCILAIVLTFPGTTKYQPYTDKTPTPFINGYPQEPK
jgi:hypothetical protein